MGVRHHRWLSLLGTLPYYLLPVKKGVIETNIHQVYGDRLNPKSVKKLVKAVYGNLIWLGLGVMWNCCLPEFMRRRSIEVRHVERMHQAFEEGKGVLWLTCHVGNWEVALVNILAREPRYKNRTTVIRKKIRPSWMWSLVCGRYRRGGIDVLAPLTTSLKKVLQKLRGNEGVVFVLDQHMSKEAATTAEFFGHDVQFTKSLARLAIKTGAPVMPIYSYRGKWGKHICEIGERIPVVEASDLEESIQKTTQAYSHQLEKIVWEHPEEWFCWTHRLWKASTSYS